MLQRYFFSKFLHEPIKCYNFDVVTIRLQQWCYAIEFKTRHKITVS